MEQHGTKRRVLLVREPMKGGVRDPELAAGIARYLPPGTRLIETGHAPTPYSLEGVKSPELIALRAKVEESGDEFTRRLYNTQFDDFQIRRDGDGDGDGDEEEEGCELWDRYKINCETCEDGKDCSICKKCRVKLIKMELKEKKEEEAKGKKGSNQWISRPKKEIVRDEEAEKIREEMIANKVTGLNDLYFGITLTAMRKDGTNKQITEALIDKFKVKYCRSTTTVICIGWAYSIELTKMNVPHLHGLVRIYGKKANGNQLWMQANCSHWERMGRKLFDEERRRTVKKLGTKDCLIRQFNYMTEDGPATESARDPLEEVPEYARRISWPNQNGGLGNVIHNNEGLAVPNGSITNAIDVTTVAQQF